MTNCSSRGRVERADHSGASLWLVGVMRVWGRGVMSVVTVKWGVVRRSSIGANAAF